MRLAIVLSITLAITCTSAYAYEISYSTTGYRLQNPPTYCIEKPSDSTDSDILVPLAQNALDNWQENLQNAEFKHPEYWKINYKVIPTSGTKSGCDITIDFVSGDQERQSLNTITLGKMFPIQNKIEIYYSNVKTPIIFNVILHEIGHSFGLGHYIADDDEVNQKFSTGDKLAPSLMIPTTQSNPDLIKIMQVDVDKVRSIYGDKGFYGFSDLPLPEAPLPTPTPKPTPSPLPTPSPIPIHPVTPFKYLKINEPEIIVGKYETKTVKISGQVNEELYHKGHPVYILIIKPDQTTEVHRLPITGEGRFEVPISFDSTDPHGTYLVEGSYMEFTDDRTNFEFSIVSDIYEKSSLPGKSTKLFQDDSSIKKQTPKPITETKKETKKEIKSETKTEKKVEKPIKKETKTKSKQTVKDSKTIKISRGQTINEKITGAIPIQLYKKGQRADVSILRPDGTTEAQKIAISNKGKFEHPFSITDRTIPGIYEITISYSGVQVKKFTYQIKN